MKTRLISYSQVPTLWSKAPQLELDKDPSLLGLIAYCARVSNPDNQNNTATNEKLVKYLMKHKHWSPLEMVSVCMEVETTRDIARQLLRHRSFSFQEFSQRYADPSVVTEDELLQQHWAQQQQRVIDTALDAYNWALSNGIAKEQARAVLPEGNTLSKLYVNGTLRSWIHYIELRGANGTQLEHMELAWAVADAITKVFPIADEFKGQEL